MPSNIRYYWNQLCKQCLGKKEEFAMENRMLNMACLMILVVLAAFFIINALTGMWSRSIIVFGVVICELLVYYYSRFKKRYHKGLVINGLISYVALGFNYYVNSGINGPTLFLFFFTLHLLISATPKKLHILWLVLHAVTITLFMGAEFIWPSFIKYTYRDNTARAIDEVAIYIVVILFIFQVTRYVLDYYETERSAARDYEFKLQAFFDNSNDCHVLLNRDCMVLYFNNSAAKFISTAYKKELKSGRNMMEFINPAYVKQFTSNCREALNNNPIQEERELRYDRLGSICWQISFMPVLDSEGNVIGLSFNAADITAARQQEHQMQLKNELLLKISYMQSHQLRQPVASIIGLMNLVKDDSPRSGEYLALIKKVTHELDDKIYEIIAQTKA